MKIGLGEYGVIEVSSEHIQGFLNSTSTSEKIGKIRRIEVDGPIDVPSDFVKGVIDYSTIIGKGAFGIVYAGKDDLYPDTLFAIKLIDPKIVIGQTLEQLKAAKNTFQREQEVSFSARIM